MPDRRSYGFLAIAGYLLALFLVIYGPTVGQGFVADDFGWVSATRPSFGEAAVKPISRLFVSAFSRIRAH